MLSALRHLTLVRFPVTTVDFPDGTGQTYSPGFLTSTLTYSKVLTDRISVGTNFKLISESIQNATATGFALDMGVQYRFNDFLAMGASLKNIGTNMQFSGQDLQTEYPGSRNKFWKWNWNLSSCYRIISDTQLF